MRASLRTAVVVLLALGLLALFLRNTDFHQVWLELMRARPGMLTLGLVATCSTYFLRAFRWQYLLLPIGRVTLSNAFRTTVIGFAASTMLPARAGEVLRPWLLARKEGLNATSAFATIILERVLDTVMVLLLFGCFLMLSGPHLSSGDDLAFSRLKLGGGIAAALSVAALAVMYALAGHPATLTRLEAAFARILPPRLARLADRFTRTFSAGLAIVRQPSRFVWSIALSVPVWLSIALGIWAVTQAFHIDMPYTGSFLLMALLVIGVAVPTPGAVGGFHYFYRLGVMAFYGASSDRAVGAAIVLHAVSFVPVTLVGLVFLAQEGMSLSRVGAIARTGGAEEAA
jgi:uncharacterized protein (TIRG00374 family)